MKHKFGILLFTTVFIALSAIHIVFAIDSKGIDNVVTKGLPILLLLGGVLFSADRPPFVLAALFFSLLGDVISELHMPSPYPSVCLIGFFGIAQIFYFLDFSKHSARRHSCKVLSVIPLMVAGYAVLILNMFVSAWRQKREHLWFYRAGSLLFLLSDSLIGVSWFITRIPHGSVLVMVTYYAAQFLLNAPVIFSHKRQAV